MQVLRVARCCTNIGMPTCARITALHPVGIACRRTGSAARARHKILRVPNVYFPKIPERWRNNRHCVPRSARISIVQSTEWALINRPMNTYFIVRYRLQVYRTFNRSWVFDVFCWAASVMGLRQFYRAVKSKYFKERWRFRWIA